MEIVTLAERPELAKAMWGFPKAWPAFMYHDQTGPLYYEHCASLYPEYVMLALADDVVVVARSFSVPFDWDGDPAQRLPAGGWEWAIRQAVATRQAGVQPTLVPAPEISIQVDQRGTGLSGLMLDAMRRNVARLGFADLVAPVRPNGKPDHPDEPMDLYLKRHTDDGLPADPWLRVHVRAGGRVVNVAPLSMNITGTLEQWRQWTSLPFDQPGPVRVPGALVPVLCEPAHGYATYVEPNVWVHHLVT